MKTTKKVLAVVLAVMMILSSFAIPAFAATDFNDGTWTAISTAAELKAITDMNGKYYLTQDINLNGSSSAQTTPIGYSNNTTCYSFKGTFDGNDHTISGFYYYNTSCNYVGLFSAIGETGIVRNLNVDITVAIGNECVGGLTGTNYGTIKNVTVTGKNIIANNTKAGGVAGENNGTICLCFTNVQNISSPARAGGITGQNTAGAIKQCGVCSAVNGTWSTGNSNDTRYFAGGIAGVNNAVIQDVFVQNCDIAGSYYVGGIAGGNTTDGTIERGYVDDIGLLYDSSYGTNVGFGVALNQNTDEDAISELVYIKASSGSSVPSSSVLGGVEYAMTMDDLKEEIKAGHFGDAWEVDEDGNLIINDPDEVEEECTHAAAYTTGASDPTCQQTGYTGDLYCPDCDTVIETGETLGKTDHKFTTYAPYSVANCASAAKEIAYCDYGCGASDIRDVAGSTVTDTHVFTTYVVTSPATCLENEVRTAICDNCGVATDEKEMENTALGHKFTNYVSDDDAKCGVDGHKTAVCDRDGCDATDTILDEGSALDHIWGEYTEKSPASCSANAVMVAECTRGCGTTNEVEVENSQLEHDFQNYTVTTAATCIANAIETGYCIHCNAPDSREIPGTTSGHTVTEWNMKSEATCQKNAVRTGICSVCDNTVEEEVEGSIKEHSYGEFVRQNDATCTKNETEAACCIYGCGATISRDIPDSKVSHQFVTYTAKDEASCTQNATEIASCIFGCGETDVREIEGTKLSHVFTNYVYQNDATCTANGTKVAACDYGCGETDSKEAENTKLEHKFTTYAYNNDATCKADGTKTASCDYNCGETDTVVAPGTMVSHSFTKYVANNDATCMANGTETAKCDYNCGTTDSRVIADSMVDHKFASYVSNGDATCTKDGTKTAVCAYGCGTESTITDTGSKLPHTYGDYTELSVATCTKNAQVTATCSECGHVDVKDVDGSALGHKVVVDAGKEATCTENGLTEGKHCSVCEETLVAQKVIKAKGHQDENDDGWCDVCGFETDPVKHCTHLCHEANKNIFYRVFWAFLRTLWKLFRIHQFCECGYQHW